MRACKLFVAVFGTLALIGGYALAANPGNPAEISADASVTIIDPIELTTVTVLAFGKVVRPVAGSTSLVVAPNGSLSGDADSLGGTTPGEVSMSADAATNVTVGVTPGGCTDPGLTLSSMTSDHAGGMGGGNFHVGGQLDVDTSASDGDHTCEYTVSAEYM